jgi:hypothetical protein
MTPTGINKHFRTSSQFPIQHTPTTGQFHNRHTRHTQHNNDPSLIIENSSIFKYQTLSTLNPKTPTSTIPIMISQMLSNKPPSKPSLLTRSLQPATSPRDHHLSLLSFPLPPHRPRPSLSIIQVRKVAITIVEFAMTGQCSSGVFAVVADIGQRVCVWF